MFAHIFLLPYLLLLTFSLISRSSSAHENSKTAFSGPACNVTQEIIFPQPSIRLQSVIHVAIVGCGGKASHEIAGLLWSLAEQPQRKYISLHLVLDSKVYDYMINCLQLLRTLFHSIDVYHIDYVKNLPCGRDGSCFHCSTCKLFLYDILSNHVKHVLYLDTDTLVLGDLSELWKVWSNKPLEPVLFIAVREPVKSKKTSILWPYRNKLWSSAHELRHYASARDHRQGAHGYKFCAALLARSRPAK